jgi:23S rRNA pseudouridine2457 synthase
MAKLILFNKPYQVLSQFTDDAGRATLAQWIKDPKVRVAGRLDYDSEGLLLLTDDGQLVQQIANPRHKLWKTYWVQVEGTATDPALQQLREGVVLADGSTRPARVQRISEPTELWARTPAIRQRADIPTAWLELSIREGRNRQVRRMTAAVDLPTLRLVRARVGDWSLENLKPGQQREILVNMPRSRALRPSRRRL